MTFWPCFALLSKAFIWEYLYVFVIFSRVVEGKGKYSHPSKTFQNHHDSGGWISISPGAYRCCCLPPGRERAQHLDRLWRGQHETQIWLLSLFMWPLGGVFVWELYGSHRVLYGICMGLIGFYMGFVWVLVGFVKGLYVFYRVYIGFVVVL